MASIPHNSLPDSTLPLLRQGYEFFMKQREKLNSDIFGIRLMLMPAIVLTSPDGAKLLYDETKFKRHGAAPWRIQKTLIGKDGVQTLDDATHKDRKAMFMSLMTPENIARIMELIEDEWQKAVPEWQQQQEVVLLDETQFLFFRAACRWAGVPLESDEAMRQHAREMGHMIDGFGAVGKRYRQGKQARKRAEEWTMQLVDEVRSGSLITQHGEALGVIAQHKGRDGSLLPRHPAAVEVLNIIRPITAIATYVAFCALALHNYPQYRENLARGNEQDAQHFVQEVRRFYPFTPFVGGRVRQAFDWRGYAFPKGRLVLLDIYGLNHDERFWRAPEVFRPGRFNDQAEDPYIFMPQGGGEFIGHRCAGEWLTIEAMKRSVKWLVRIQYDLPTQDLSIDLARIPTKPASGVIIRNISS